MTQEELQERLKKLLQEFASLVSDLENGKAEPINPSVSDEVADKIAKKICLYCGKPLIEWSEKIVTPSNGDPGIARRVLTIGRQFHTLNAPHPGKPDLIGNFP